MCTFVLQYVADLIAPAVWTCIGSALLFFATQWSAANAALRLGPQLNKIPLATPPCYRDHVTACSQVLVVGYDTHHIMPAPQTGSGTQPAGGKERTEFTEDTQENLYMALHNAKSSGKTGLGKGRGSGACPSLTTAP